MKQKLLQLVILIVFLSLGSMFLYALDDQGIVNDPTQNDRANACYEDGSMAGKCTSDWEWVCGWYMIRFDYGILSREEVPSFCGSLLPSLPVVETLPDKRVPTIGCVGPIYGFAYVDFGSSNYLTGSFSIYDDAACISTYSPGFANLAYTTGGLAAAQAICDANAVGNTAAFLANNIYSCS